MLFRSIKCYKITEKTGNVIGAKAVNEENEVMLITNEGIIIRIPCNGISIVGRIASGVKLMNVDSENVVVASIAKVRNQEDSGEETSDQEEVPEDSEKTE